MVLVNNGVNEIRDWLAGVAATAPAVMAVGDNNTAETISDSALANELLNDTFDLAQTSNKEVVFTWTVLSTEQNGQSLKEFGLFASAAGTMYTRATHATISKTAAIEVRYRIRLRLVN